MTFGTFDRVGYDQYLNISSFTLGGEDGVLKTWILQGDLTIQLQNIIENASNSEDLMNAFEPILNQFYIGHRAIKFDRLYEQNHSINLTELNIEGARDTRVLMNFLIDPILEKVKESAQTLKFTIDPVVVANFKEKGYLKDLYGYVMSRDLSKDNVNNEISHEKKHSLKLLDLKSKYMPRGSSEHTPRLRLL
jgi:hypothetical protein